MVFYITFLIVYLCFCLNLKLYIRQVMSTELCNEFLLLVLQFLDEEKYKETLHRLESESGAFCNVDYIGELVTNGDWDVLENYLAGFINVNGNHHSVKMLFEIRKQRYIEALNA
ncbi:putative transcription factor interactor and regulator LisH family [Helianthus annuus]|nr:putative transcription factor interactor and regulator LisH family [Helianthus annuus]KAJ0846844.1 putative transcription factor interactor and regulator LisH family [Helianthus annuus]